MPNDSYNERSSDDTYFVTQSVRIKIPQAEASDPEVALQRVREIISAGTEALGSAASRPSTC